MHKRWIWPFELEEQIGAGAMGVVYRARYVKNDRKVALKLLPENMSPQSTYLARFERELEILKDLRHPHIVHCFGGTCDGEQRFYAMELVEGGTLQELLTQRGFLPWRQVVEFGQQICSALAYAHDQGVIHRDVKPGNLLLTKGGKVKLSDFGLALVAAGNKLTAEGKTMGTLHYMSPEQIRGSPPLTSQSDLYSLGCMLFEMLTGRPPFDGATAGEILHQHIHQAPPRAASIAVDCPAYLDELIADLLEKDPDRRPPDALEVTQRLSSPDATRTAAAPLKRVEATPAKPPSGSEPTASASRVWRSAPDWNRTAGLMLLTALVVWFSVPRTPDTPDERARALWVRALGDANPAVRLTAARSVGQIGPAAKQAVLPLMQLLNDADPELRGAAAQALGELGISAKSVMPTLIRIEKTDEIPSVRDRAAIAVASLRAARPDDKPGGSGWKLFWLALLFGGGIWSWMRRARIKATWETLISQRLSQILG